MANEPEVDFFNEVKKDELLKEEAFAPKEEAKPQEEEVVKEEKIPFHKDPKVQRYVEKEIAKAISSIKPEPKESSEDDSIQALVDSFKTIVGDDTPEKRTALSSLEHALNSMDERATRKAMEALQSEKESELQEEKAAEEELAQGFETIEEATGINLYAPQNKKLRIQFIDFIEQVAPKDEDGEISEFPDLEQTFKVFQATRKQPASKAKELASETMERSEGSVTETKPQEKTTFDNWRKRAGLE